MKIRCNAFYGWAGALLVAPSVLAAPVSNPANLLIFGNSLSDTGNTAQLVGGEGYFEGRASNSYVWNEYAAKILGMNLVNRAYSGATSDNDLSPATSGNISIPSLHDQVTMWLQANPQPSQYHLDNDVIEIEIGGNDILGHVGELLSGTTQLTDFANKLATTIASDIQRLADVGYKNIVLWNLPAVDKTPAVNSLGAGALVKPVVDGINYATNAYVEAVVKSDPVKTQGIRVFDLNNIMNVALDPKVLQVLGITDSTDACYSKDTAGNVNICTDADAHFFYDSIHPASRVHYLWGAAAAVLTRNPDAKMDINEILSLISTYDIGHSNRNNNILVD
ncbi:hypothetical protein LPJ63_002871, partial [Coemansia sp. RSA 2711]